MSNLQYSRGVNLSLTEGITEECDTHLFSRIQELNCFKLSEKNIEDSHMKRNKPNSKKQFSDNLIHLYHEKR